MSSRPRRPAPTGAAGTRPIRVLVVDDQPVFRQVAREVIEATESFVVSGEASSGPQALALVAELEPDLVLLDVRMPGMDGIETAGHLHADHPELVMVLVTLEEAPHLPGGMSSCGAATVLRKQDFGPTMLRWLWARHGSPRKSRPSS